MINRFKNIEIKKVLIILVIILFAFSALFSLSSNDKIAILEIEGVIKNPKQYLESMRDISEDDSIKGLIVRIDSPGGTVGSSQEIHESLLNHQRSLQELSISFACLRIFVDGVP